MHELSLIADLISRIEQIARNNNSRRVIGVKIQLGALSNISEQHFREHFKHGAAGSMAENADLEIVVSEDIEDPNAQVVVLIDLNLEL